MRHGLSILTVALLFGIAACSDSSDKSTEAEKAPETQTAPKTETTVKEDKPAAEPKTAPKAAEQDVTTVTNNACLAAAKEQTGEANIAVASNEFSEANTLVMLEVGAQKAPWRCLVSNDGTVQEVMFTGDDSAGVPEQPQPSGSDVSAAAVDACLAAVTGQTNENNVTVLSTEFSEANSLVMVGVGDQKAPWRCLVSNDGTVQEVMFTGDEGKL